MTYNTTGFGVSHTNRSERPVNPPGRVHAEPSAIGIYAKRSFGHAIDMIGEMVGELTGKVIGQRIVHHWGGPMKLERTLESRGKILGTEVTFLATTYSMERRQGGMFSKGSGILMTAKGEKAELHGAGISVLKGGAWSIRGTRYLQTTAAAFKRLNDVALPFEIEISPDGTYHDKWWEWK